MKLVGASPWVHINIMYGWWGVRNCTWDNIGGAGLLLLFEHDF